MTISLKHAFTSGKADGTDTTLVQPSDWNAEHELLMATARVLGRHTAGNGAVEELTADQIYDILGLIGKTMIFNDAAVPTGWTKKTTKDNAALRLVSGEGGDGGGTANFTTAFAGRTIAKENLPAYNLSHSLSFSDSFTTSSDSHNHSYGNAGNSGSTKRGDGSFFDYASIGSGTTSSDSHSHTGSVSGPVTGTISLGGSGTAMDFAVKYIDVIAGTKDAIA